MVKVRKDGNAYVLFKAQKAIENELVSIKENQQLLKLLMLMMSSNKDCSVDITEENGECLLKIDGMSINLRGIAGAQGVRGVQGVQGESGPAGEPNAELKKEIAGELVKIDHIFRNKYKEFKTLEKNLSDNLMNIRENIVKFQSQITHELYFDESQKLFKQSIEDDMRLFNETFEQNKKVMIEERNHLVREHDALSTDPQLVEIKTVKDKLNKDFTDFTAQIRSQVNRLIMGGGAAGGGGEVNLRFLDDIDRDSISSGGVMYYHAATEKFRFASNIRITEGDILHIDTYALTKQSITPSGGAIDINYANGNHVTLSLTQDVTSFNVTTWPVAPEVGTLTLTIRQANTGSHTIDSWPTGTKFPDGIPPVLSTANGSLDLVVLNTSDGGTEIIGTSAGLNYQTV